MKKLVLAAALLGASSTFALAADLPSRRAPPVFIPPALPVVSWTGLYAGINAGYAFQGNTYYNLSGNTAAQIANIGTGATPGFFKTTSNGFTGGGQIGYNYQLGNSPLPLFGTLGGAGGGFVIGVEADAAYTDGRGNGFFTGNTGLTTTFTSRVDYVGTARGRIGYAFGDFLVFGTGGFAYGGVRNSVNYFNAAGVNTFGGATNSIRTGYAYGGGVEYMIPTTSFVNFFHSSAVTLKAEFLHYDLGTQSVLVPSFTTGNSYTANIKNNGNLVRAGINYKIDFGGPMVPVVARY